MKTTQEGGDVRGDCSTQAPTVMLTDSSMATDPACLGAQFVQWNVYVREMAKKK